MTNLIFPLAGAAVCFYIWLNLSFKARVAGFGWLALGLIYLAVHHARIPDSAALAERLAGGQLNARRPSKPWKNVSIDYVERAATGCSTLIGDLVRTQFGEHAADGQRRRLPAIRRIRLAGGWLGAGPL